VGNEGCAEAKLGEMEKNGRKKQQGYDSKQWKKE
jgi:hypothetical protein